MPVEPLPPIVIWPEGTPGALGDSPDDIPTLVPYLPDPAKATGTAVVVLPGGGYTVHAPHEAGVFGNWLADQGIAAFVLYYRLGSKGYRHPAMWDDVSRAMRIVRGGSADWGIDPQRIGVMGASAGGHLAATILTHYDAGNPESEDLVERQSSRPDFGILCYAVISFMDPTTHFGSMKNLLGEDPPMALRELLSGNLHVTAETAPCFIWSTGEDKAVPVNNSLLFAQALAKHGVPFDLHVYEKGVHGISLGQNATDPAKLHPWTDDLLYWFSERGLLKK